MKIVFTLELVEILIDYVVSITDPLLYIIHCAERKLIDGNIRSCVVTIDSDLELNRLKQVIDFMINDDITIPVELVKLFKSKKL